MIKLNLTKDVAKHALNVYLNTLQRKRNKETNLMICEILDKDIEIIQNGINTIADSK